jgi:hypothetical protein
MAKVPANIAASAKTRLLALSRAEKQPFDVLLVRFALERLLYRLSISPQRDNFILKGGLLVTLWLEDSNRVTRDMDFLTFGDASAARLIADFSTIMQIEADDGLVFDTKGLTAKPIREEAEYGGMRLSTIARLERARIPVTIDLGFGDAIAKPARPDRLSDPAGFSRSRDSRLPPATVIAEKFQAMVALGIANSRMKDYYDLWALPQAIPIAADDLDAAIRATFERRRTDIPRERPPGLSGELVDDETKQRQWRGYAASIELEGLPLAEVVEAIWAFVGPSCQRLTER